MPSSARPAAANDGKVGKDCDASVQWQFKPRYSKGGSDTEFSSQDGDDEGMADPDVAFASCEDWCRLEFPRPEDVDTMCGLSRCAACPACPTPSDGLCVGSAPLCSEAVGCTACQTESLTPEGSVDEGFAAVASLGLPVLVFVC